MLAEVEPISVIFVIPEDAIQDVWDEVEERDQKLAVSAYDRSDDKLIGTGTLESVDNLIDTTTGTVKLRARPPTRTRSFFPISSSTRGYWCVRSTRRRLRPSPLSGAALQEPCFSA